MTSSMKQSCKDMLERRTTGVSSCKTTPSPLDHSSGSEDGPEALELLLLSSYQQTKERDESEDTGLFQGALAGGAVATFGDFVDKIRQFDCLDVGAGPRPRVRACSHSVIVWQRVTFK